jgi:hypothetical protein
MLISTSDPYLKVHSVHGGEWRNYFSCVQRIFYMASFLFSAISAKISFNFIIFTSPYDIYGTSTVHKYSDNNEQVSWLEQY